MKYWNYKLGKLHELITLTRYNTLIHCNTINRYWIIYL